MDEFITIRHGESQYNALLTDNLDSELTPKGVAQARATGKFLKEHFGHIQDFMAFTSPYLRCLQTSQLIQEETGLEFTVTPGPRECMVHYERVEVPNRMEQFPQFVWNIPCRSKHFFGQSWQFHMETEDEFINRMSDFMEESKTHQKAIIVSHGTPVQTMYEMRLGIVNPPNITTCVANATVSYARNGEGIWLGKVIPWDIEI
jgi:broad specificity phosphatase PhoE